MNVLQGWFLVNNFCKKVQTSMIPYIQLLPYCMIIAAIINAKTAKLYKRVHLQSLGEKSCEIKGGGHEMAVMMLIMHNAII